MAPGFATRARTGSMTPRELQTAALLNNGEIIVAGAYDAHRLLAPVRLRAVQSGDRSVDRRHWRTDRLRYTYVGDTAAGQNNGNGKDLSGGIWHEVTVSGAAAPAPAKSSSSGGGYGY